MREARADPRGAVRALDRAAELDRNDTYPLVRKAVILSGQGKYPEALRLLETASRMDPGNVSISDEMERVSQEAGAYVPEAPSVEEVPDRIPDMIPEPVAHDSGLAGTIDSYDEADQDEPVPVPQPVPQPVPAAKLSRRSRRRRSRSRSPNPSLQRRRRWTSTSCTRWLSPWRRPATTGAH